MSNQGFPGTHTTTTTTATTTKVTPVIRFDHSYVLKLPGWLKCGECLISLLGFICSRSSRYNESSSANWYGFVSMTAFWVTLILLVMYLFHIIEKIHFIPWILGEFVYCAIWTLFYCIAAIVVAAKASGDDAYAAAAVFGFIAMVIYGVDAFLKYKAWRRGDIAQGERVVSTTTTTQTAY
ncbi:plasmolipin-like [Centruroides sculpturatus]|uniref:plasmolipin-like n=1 Tax=Centruroides sculpturatus TaxID=218467 RepID=UPI000C6DD7F6|nr:plasmolipin-like [Centruroides sculpturatus]XP_023235392.1 plasmolipin-like [Centruroides sculpturatus]XP_023235394.1 plasmolipin-like [Centruroides sculpturatus]